MAGRELLRPRLQRLSVDRTANPHGRSEFACAICLGTITEPFLTRCGHSFCYKCISEQLEHKPACPTCLSPLTREDIFPNKMLSELVSKYIEETTPVESLKVLLVNGAENALSGSEVDKLLAVLMRKKRALQLEHNKVDLEVCSDFLSAAYRAREEKRAQLEKEMAIIQADLALLKKDMETYDETAANNNSNNTSALPSSSSSSVASVAVPVGDKDASEAAAKRLRMNSPEKDVGAEDHRTRAALPVDTDVFAAAALPDKPEVSKQDAISQKKRRITSHFEDLEKAYFDSHSLYDASGTQGRALHSFQSSLAKFTSYSRFHVSAQLKYGNVFQTSSIVSSIEFDRDEEYFATAGVTKKIKIYEYRAIVEQPNVETHTPVKEMSCRSKISCLSWNPYLKEQIVSSDYEGIVSLWDACTGQKVSAFEEHEKRAWSVDFAPANPTRLASGSDDSKVKIWSVNQDHSVATIDSKANVCCVKFNPDSADLIAFGSADHHIHYYDLRNLRSELFVFKGHAKAVSYVRFLNSAELISASTDSTLKLWSTSQNECKRTFTGHVNEKNFVGLSTSSDYIACGSENNAVFTYYKALSKPIVSHRFKTSSADGNEDSSNFVSSVCWKKDSGVLLAANSLGTINIMQLV
eukprot:m.182253 g.182253  ORF g.182253 m.182253 type:complete len:637 (-) comp17457_c0_seq1:1962-3872(-)